MKQQITKKEVIQAIKDVMRGDSVLEHIIYGQVKGQWVYVLSKNGYADFSQKWDWFSTKKNCCKLTLKDCKEILNKEIHDVHMSCILDEENKRVEKLKEKK